MTNSAMVRLDDVWKRISRRDVLRGVTLSVQAGSAYALVGANGSGKTTTLKLIMNIISPSSGSGTVMGADIRKIPPRVLAEIGYVSESQILPSRLTVGAYFDYLRCFYPAWDKQLERSIRNRLCLPADQKIGDLSHGTRIKVALACALPYRPRLLILDEPFGGIDPLVREEFMEGLLSESDGLTILISSHELNEIENVTTHVGFLDAGRLLFEESMSDLSNRIREVCITLDSPADVPGHLPCEWIDVRVVGNVLSFVDTRHDVDSLGAQVRASIGPVRRIDSQPMSLRSIVLSLARAERDRHFQ